ncbi:hypothetical protein IG631_02339 [Alternaria alternata]|nr:hypothetical protein IG631_02339 [Alternaria alternata]
MIGSAAGVGRFCCASVWKLRDGDDDADVSSPESSDAIGTCRQGPDQLLQYRRASSTASPCAVCATYTLV